mmetsp:Transcript_1646/g.4913  ORF Transcript_1646/g.4913 Transcript_1646/m.4913 type:complete len:243 (+) Transcript_1646:1474-2202(+)
MRPMNCFMRSEFGETASFSTCFASFDRWARRFSRGPCSFARMSSAASLPRSLNMFVTNSPDCALSAAFFSSASFFCAARSSMAFLFWFCECALWKDETKSPRRSLKNCSTPHVLGSSPKDETRRANRSSVFWKRDFNVSASATACSRNGAITSTNRSCFWGECFLRAATCIWTNVIFLSNCRKSSCHCVRGHLAASSMSGKSAATSSNDASRRSQYWTSQFMRDFWLSSDFTVANFARASNL